MTGLFVLGFAIGSSMAPAQAGSILISGSREGNRIIVTGEAPGVWPMALMPIYRIEDRPEQYGIPFIAPDGSFTWKRTSKREITVRIETSDGLLVSNEIVFPAATRLAPR